MTIDTKENSSWGYDRIVGVLANPGYTLSDETVGNILRRNAIPPAPGRMQITTWRDFIRAHMAVLAGTDFFTVEVLTLRGLVTYYVLFFIHLESRRAEVTGITSHPNERWMMQIARNVTMDEWGFLDNCRFLIRAVTRSSVSRFVGSLNPLRQSHSSFQPGARI